MKFLRRFFFDLGVLFYCFLFFPWWTLRRWMKDEMQLDYWRHKEKGTIYVLLPGRVTIEKEWVPGVRYVDAQTGREIVRPESEFFDGRFEQLK